MFYCAKSEYGSPAGLFCIGCGIVLLTLWISVGPQLDTFIHMWRVELTASVFLLAAFSYLIFSLRAGGNPVAVSRDELTFIILPVAAFIAWSGLSALWAPSWRSAIHHTLVWSEYLLFYLIVRQLIDHGRNYRKVTLMLAVVFVMLAIPAIAEYCAFLVFGGTTSLGIRYAKYGEQINAIMPVLLVGILPLNGKRFAFGLAAVAAMWLLIFCSLGRINLFLFVCGIISVGSLVFLFRRFHKYRRKMLIAVAVLVLAPLPLHVFTLFSDDAGVPMVRRISDSSGISSSNNFRKLMATLSIEMFKAHPAVGIGADNFGTQLNDYRAVYGSQNPADVNLAAAENDLPERAHNEYLQIIAELGIVGGLIFFWFLFGIAVLAFKVLWRRTSLVPLAAAVGIAMFLVSSLVSSYSFRFIQNGFVFFFILAVLAKFLRNSGDKQAAPIEITAGKVKIACAFGIVACLLLASYSLIRVSSVYYTQQANYIQDIDLALPVYQKAMSIDSENPNPHLYLGHRSLGDGHYHDAVQHLSQAIKMGQGGSPTFSYLATAQFLAADLADAEATFAEAVKLYPRSAFVLTRHAFFLKLIGKDAESAKRLEQAFALNKPAAVTWWVMINEGAIAASQNASQNKDVALIMDLTPTAAIYAVQAERELCFPEEKAKFPGK